MTGTVFITGASRGIGFAAARLFAENGYKVCAGYFKTPAPLEALAREMPGRVFPVYGDVTRSDDVERMFSLAPAPDVLINNAGAAQFMPFADMSESDWDFMLNSNLKSAFLCSKLALPAMLARKSGCIINISSVWGVTGGSCEVHYSAAKAGLIGLTKALAKELGPSNIRVNCIAPGVIDTDMTADLSESDRRAICEQTALGRLGGVDEIARAALFLAQSDFITGEVLNVNGGFHI